MARGPLTFRQRDVERAIKAAKRAGLSGEVKITRDGDIVVLSRPPDEPEEVKVNTWDRVLAK